MAAEVLTVVCAWCQRVITAAPAGTRVTHTICQSCLDRTAQLGDGETDPMVLNPPPDYFGDAFKH